MPEDIELAPEWLQEEIGREPQELRDWLGGQGSIPKEGTPAPRIRVGRRGRRPKQ